MLLCIFDIVVQLATFFFFNDTATTEIYTLSLHDALPIYRVRDEERQHPDEDQQIDERRNPEMSEAAVARQRRRDRKSTRLNSSHLVISYAVFCLKKKKNIQNTTLTSTRPISVTCACSLTD